jgi:hypothetical protein
MVDLNKYLVVPRSEAFVLPAPPRPITLKAWLRGLLWVIAGLVVGGCGAVALFAVVDGLGKQGVGGLVVVGLIGAAMLWGGVVLLRTGLQQPGQRLLPDGRGLQDRLGLLRPRRVRRRVLRGDAAAVRSPRPPASALTLDRGAVRAGKTAIDRGNEVRCRGSLEVCMKLIRETEMVVLLSLVMSVTACSNKDVPIAPDPVARSTAALHGGGAPPGRMNTPDTDADQYAFIHVTVNAGDPSGKIIDGPFMVTTFGAPNINGAYLVQGPSCDAPPSIDPILVFCAPAQDDCRLPVPTGSSLCMTGSDSGPQDVFVRGYRPYR